MPRGERPSAEIRHETPGRIRLHVPALLTGGADADALSSPLKSGGARARLKARPLTGSVVVQYEGARTAVMQALSARFAIAPPTAFAQARAHTAPPPGRDAPDGATRLADAAFLLLLTVAAAQAARGRLAGPALSVVADAFAIASALRRSRA